MKATFENSVNVLVKAYFDGYLEHQNCACCAVGNIIASACGFKIEHLNDRSLWTRDSDQEVIDPQEWVSAFGTRTDILGKNFFRKKKVKVSDQWFNPEKITRRIKSWASMTGYSVVELARIESAFESAPYGDNDDSWMFNGLMAVVDVLAEIHGIDLTTKESAKLLFVKA